MGEAELPALMAATDALVVPSIYEPFGMVALEGASAGAPLAVAETGGLAEIVEADVTGVKFAAKNPDALAGSVRSLLENEPFARRVATTARAMVGERYAWRTIADDTVAVYTTAFSEQPADLDGGRPRIVVPEGNLLAMS
jgi:glycogen(starch) synthase